MYRLLALIGIYSEHVRVQNQIHIGWFWFGKLIRINPKVAWTQK